MAKTLLQIIQQAAGELSLTQPTAILSSQASDIQQLKALVVAACEELVDIHDWQRLITPWTVTPYPGGSGTTVAGVASYALPPDVNRIIPNTFWDSTNTRVVPGGYTSSQWSRLSDATPTSGYRYRFANNKITLFPTPGAAESIRFDYISNNYVYDVGLGVRKPEFTLDSDQVVFPDRLVTNFVKLKFLQEQGMNTEAAAENFNTSLVAAKANDVPSPTLYLGASGGMHYLDASNIPARNWGL